MTYSRRAWSGLVLVGAVLGVLGVPGALPAQSQATTGIIRGVVVNPNGNPVSQATVAVRDLQRNFTRRLATDEKGVFVASLLPLGTYEVTAKAVGYSQATQTGVPVRVGETVNLRLALAAVELPPVVVEAREAVVEASEIAASARLPEHADVNLPHHEQNLLNLPPVHPHR